ncbi:hypothetical protein GOV05_03470 [Candidatus Woesearchaeota archaeon]|nr:hypothetical protein [Candidatus Woesearchaeota archaeon]
MEPNTSAANYLTDLFSKTYHAHHIDGLTENAEGYIHFLLDHITKIRSEAGLEVGEKPSYVRIGINSSFLSNMNNYMTSREFFGDLCAYLHADINDEELKDTSLYVEFFSELRNGDSLELRLLRDGSPSVVKIIEVNGIRRGVREEYEDTRHATKVFLGGLRYN